MCHVINLHQVWSNLILQLLSYTMNPSLIYKSSVISKRDHLLGNLIIIKPSLESQGNWDHLFQVVSIASFCHTSKKQKMWFTSFSKTASVSMDIQPLLVVNCCDFITWDANIVYLCQCFLDLIKNYMGNSMNNLQACWFRLMLARLMRHIQSIE